MNITIQRFLITAWKTVQICHYSTIVRASDMYYTMFNIYGVDVLKLDSTQMQNSIQY